MFDFFCFALFCGSVVLTVLRSASFSIAFSIQGCMIKNIKVSLYSRYRYITISCYVLGGTVCFCCSWLLVVFVVWSEFIKGFWAFDIY